MTPGTMGGPGDGDSGTMTDRTVLRVVSKTLIPFIVLFALYTQFHGDYGPGGGFQAGVIFASAFIVYGLIFDTAEVRRVAPPRVIEILVAVGVLLYGGVGLLTIALGGNFLEYGVLDPHDPKHGQHLGLLLIELGVGITVASVFIAVVDAFAARGREL